MFEYRQEEELRVWAHLQAPRALDTLERVQLYDDSAQRAIRDAEEMIAQLQVYRLELCQRAAFLATAPYTLRLELERYRHYQGSVTYYVRIMRVYVDGQLDAQPELEEAYPGPERHKAHARFRELQKSRPGIECRVDIERRGWEKR